ncbi:XXYS1_4_G0021220.mRNA.1.CDS.1 [Saccharomyces cerevisiae]|nr:XXYS1_4_G0021220.mRNA.1.CDS.1 [Saccharomyces cerevisiae]
MRAFARVLPFRHQRSYNNILLRTVRLFGSSFSSFDFSRQMPKVDPDNTAAMLLQKNLIQRNNMLYGYGSGTIRCTLLDSTGRAKSPLVEIKREDLVSKHGLLPRDLRKIEKSRKNDLVPSLLVRENSILISLLTVKALIKPDMVIIFDSAGSGITLNSEAHKDFINDMKLRLENQETSELNSDPLPYEFRALETIFISALSNLTSEMKVLLTICKGVLQDLEFSITRNKLRFLLGQNKKLSSFNKKAVLVKDMLDDLLEQDDMLCDMYLTDKKAGKIRVQDDHTEIEMLLETYHNYVDEIVQKSESAISDVKTTEEIINIILDSNRNELMLLGIRYAIGMLSLGGALFLGSIYGMNLESFIEESNYAYLTVTILGLISTVWLYAKGIRHLHKLQRMTLLSKIKTDSVHELLKK